MQRIGHKRVLKLRAWRFARCGSVFRQVIEYFFQGSVQFGDLGLGQAFETGAEDIAGAVLDFFDGMAADIGEET